MDAQATTDNKVKLKPVKRDADDRLIKSKALWEFLGRHIRDAIQRKKAVEALRHGYEYFRSIVKDAPCAIICISPQGRILEFNACARDLWKQGRDEVTGKSFLETCISRSERFNVYVVLRKILAGESANRIRTTITHADGRCGSLLWDFSPMRTDGETISNVIAVARESTTAMVKIDNRLSAMKLTSNPDFNDAVETIINSLSEILEKIEDINNRTDPNLLKRLAGELCRSRKGQGRIQPDKATAVKRLILSLITTGQDTASLGN